VTTAQRYVRQLKHVLKIPRLYEEYQKLMKEITDEN